MKYNHSKFKSNCHLLEQITAEYVKAKMTLEHKEELKKVSLIKEEGGYYSLTEDKCNSYKFFINHINKVLDMLEPIDKEFIENDFLEKENPFWWNNCYSKSSYYRNKKKALEMFLHFYKL